MPGLQDPSDPAFTTGPNAGKWTFNTSKGVWESTDPVTSALMGAGSALGLGADLITPGSPGAALSLGQSGEDRNRMGGYLSQLQNQAATGGGAWEQALAQNTHATENTATALGQSSGLDPMNASRSIGNARAGAEQRAVGQGNLLRAQTQQQATGQLSDILAGQQAADASQAGSTAAASQGVLQANHGLAGAADKARRDTVGAFGQAAIGGMSDGGSVPGKPRVFGDTSVNDTVPAKLTPQEIVLPLSVTLADDAPARAAAFVAAVKARGANPHQHAFAPGGPVPAADPNYDANNSALPSGGIHDGDVLYSRQLAPGKVQADAAAVTGQANALANQPQDPSIANGGLLDTRGYDATRGAQMGNASSLLNQFNGQGPSVGPQAEQNATDGIIGDAMRAQASGHHPLDVAGAAAEQGQAAAGNAAGIVAGESQRGGEAFAQALQRQRQQDLSLAVAKQQAAWRNTMMNKNISLEQQNQLRGLLGASGQAASAVSGMFGGDKPGDSYHYDAGTSRYDTTPAWEDPTASAPGEWQQPFAEGGVVAHLSRQGTRPKATRPESVDPASEARRAETGKRLRDRITPPVVDSSWQGVLRHGGGTQTEDDQQFASGGPVLFDSNVTATPQSGPFDAAPDAASLPTFLARLMGRGQDVPLTPEQQAQRLATSTPAGPVAPAPQVAPKPQAAPPAAAPAQKPAPKPAAPAQQRSTPAAPKGPDQYALAQKAGEEKAAAESQSGEAQTATLQALQPKLEANAIAQSEIHARASEAAQRQLGAIQQARDEMKALDVSVDPDRYMAKRGWAGKVAACIGLALGAVGNDNGVNRAAQLLGQQIDRDLDAQKSEHELQLRKGQSAVDSAQNVFSISRQMTQDDIAANAAARGTMLDLAKNQVDLAIAKTQAPMAKANLSALSAKLAGEKEAADNAVKQRGFDNHIKQQNADSDRMRAEADVAAAGNKAAAGDKTQAALLAQYGENFDVIQKSGIQLKALIKKYGTSGGITGPGRAEMQQLVNDIATARAKLNDPTGQARASEVEAEARNFFQPGFLQSEKTANATIDAYLANSQKRRDAAFGERGQAPGAKPAAKSAGQDDAGARAWLADPKNASSPFRAKVQAKLEGR